MNKLIPVVLIMLVLALGCQGERKVWGKGELDANWVEMFGEGNGARLDFVQTDRINEHRKRISEHRAAIQELEKRVQSLEVENPAELAERVRKLENKGNMLSRHIEDALGEARFIGKETSVVTGAPEQENETGNVTIKGEDPTGHTQGTCLVDHSESEVQ